MRKLGSFNRQNRLYRAFRELGRVERTLFLLRYLRACPQLSQTTAAARWRAPRKWTARLS